MQNQRAQIEWRDGNVPVSTRFDDPYFSLENGVAETEHVFLTGNELPQRFVPGFHIAELGFGTGLNLLVAWDAWAKAGQLGDLHFTSFEAFPLSQQDLAIAASAFPEFDGRRDLLVAAWTASQGEGRRLALPGVVAEIVIGDARQTLPLWQGSADAWFLDGFSPAKNPEMWSEELMSEVARHTKEGGTAATYTAAGFVRRGLETAGFEVTRSPGYGRKRHMTTGKLRSA